MLLGLGVAVVLLAAVWVVREFLKSPEAPGLAQGQTQATVLAEPIGIADFNLLDQQGNRFTLDSLKGQWAFLFFGYTHCPDVCPTTISLLMQVDKKLQQFTELEKPRYIFVSIDPERDTPEKLTEYMAFFHQDFGAITGPKEQLDLLTKPLGIFYEKNKPDEEGNYSINHTTAILLVDPQARVRSLTSPPHDAAAIAKDYRYVLAN